MKLLCVLWCLVCSLSGCTLGIPDADSSIPPPKVQKCEVRVTVDGRPAGCMTRDEFDKHWRPVLGRQ